MLHCKSKILAIIKDGEPVDEIVAGDTAEIIVDRTPFFGASGGQVGDVGTITKVDDRGNV